MREKRAGRNSSNKLTYAHYRHYCQDYAEQNESDAVDGRARQNPFQLRDVFRRRDHILPITVVRDVGRRVGRGFLREFAAQFLTRYRPSRLDLESY